VSLFPVEDAYRYDDEAWIDPTYQCNRCGSRWRVPQDEEDPCPKAGCGGTLKREPGQ